MWLEIIFTAICLTIIWALFKYSLLDKENRFPADKLNTLVLALATIGAAYWALKTMEAEITDFDYHKKLREDVPALNINFKIKEITADLGDKSLLIEVTAKNMGGNDAVFGYNKNQKFPKKTCFNKYSEETQEDIQPLLVVMKVNIDNGELKPAWRCYPRVLRVLRGEEVSYWEESIIAPGAIDTFSFLQPIKENGIYLIQFKATMGKEAIEKLREKSEVTIYGRPFFWEESAYYLVSDLKEGA